MKNIKKTLAIAIVFLSISFVSCSSDDNSFANLTEADILGIWELQDLSILANEKVIYFEDISKQGPCEYVILEFKKDNVLVETYSSEEREGKCDFEINNYYWELDDQVLRLVIEGNTYELPIRREGKRLIISNTEIVDEEFIEDFPYYYGETNHNFVLGEEVVFESTYRKK